MFVNFSHNEVTTGSDNYLRRSDTRTSAFEHAVIQMPMRRRGAITEHLVCKSTSYYLVQ